MSTNNKFGVEFIDYWTKLSRLVAVEQEIKNETIRAGRYADIDSANNKSKILKEEKLRLVKEIIESIRNMYFIPDGAVTKMMLTRFWTDKNIVKESFSSFVSEPDPLKIIENILD